MAQVRKLSVVDEGGRRPRPPSPEALAQMKLAVAISCASSLSITARGESVWP